MSGQAQLAVIEVLKESGFRWTTSSRVHTELGGSVTKRNVRRALARLAEHGLADLIEFERTRLFRLAGVGIGADSVIDDLSRLAHDPERLAAEVIRRLAAQHETDAAA